MNDGLCKGCDTPLAGRRKDCEWCSDSCRLDTTRREADSELASKRFWEAMAARRSNRPPNARRARQSATGAKP